MRDKWRNIFLAIGIIAIVVMLFTFPMDSQSLLQSLKRAGVWLPAVVVLWAFIYLLNAWSWYAIIHDGHHGHIPFRTVYKLTISSFALNYATPVGLMGGEPYRIMELTPYVGASKAASSVILYVMMHIFSHFCFWMTASLLFLLTRPSGAAMTTLSAILLAVCLLAVYIFAKGYRQGLALRSLGLLSRLPWVGRWARSFKEKKQESLQRIDAQIAALHGQRPLTFYLSLGLEYMARIVGSLEVYFILSILTPDVSFLNCIFIMAFYSLFANLLFFSPMQLGTREGGLALAASGLAIPGAYGVYTGLITRVRELIWIIVGVLLMKIGNKPKTLQS